jgi:REP element-mobilizing transposase RayT
MIDGRAKGGQVEASAKHRQDKGRAKRGQIEGCAKRGEVERPARHGQIERVKREQVERMKRGQVEMAFRTHGGKRPGAGRKPKGPRAGARHQARPEHDPRHPVHVTIRVVGSAAGLRRKDMYLAIREATIVTAKREDFHIVHMSIQRDHLHLIVESDSRAALSKGVRGFSISAARQINKAISERGGDRRTGRVVAERFHARPVTCPRAVRNAVAYTLLNWRHHGEDQAAFARTWQVDPFSSGALFCGWKELEASPVFWPLPSTYHPLIVFRPRTWLLRSWDRFHPLISVREVPGP